MKKVLAALAAFAGAQAVCAKALTVPQIQQATAQTTAYDCQDGKSVTVRYVNTKNGQSFALLPVEGKKLLFVNVMSGSGARYVADRYTWWTKGPEGTLSNGMADSGAPPMLAGCKARAR
ncbi:Predicted periplasmic protein [Caballeronia glathei]|jgi:membrane-bound inhibitor of C-type lysozyme|uniref:Transcriptional regulator n=1 Tax=Caballeronia glathei TaxID=60547 RepID=A0A069PTX1_9BURK|nr:MULTISPECIES: MliC family protein [Burkholderiaceae]KDR40731.1 transcriptional regulator [Caballeronia glathei]TCK44251.1 membrane-bound inhibitor of C-type lysozyme [Paraburkholderia sp. BL8N3]CDY79692.1 Predicted periplasmic protein [Caballeronia glathei]